MHTSRQGIAHKAAQEQTSRFRNLFGLLTITNLIWCWSKLNKRSAPGIDRITARMYGRDLVGHVTALVGRVKVGIYRVRLILRRYIPKGEGKWRPLGLPVTEDKLLQTAVAQILTAMYEADFLPCSYGYRAGIGAREAVKQLSLWLYYHPIHDVVEADIKEYVDHLRHDLLREMLERRIEDNPFLRLIQKMAEGGDS